MWSIIAASVVVFPEPVAPVTRIEAPVLLGELLDAGAAGSSCSKFGTVLRDDAEGERDGAALAEGVDAEARQVLVLVGDVEVAGVVEVRELLGRAAADGLEDRQRGRPRRAAGKPSIGTRSPSRRRIGGRPSFR